MHCHAKKETPLSPHDGGHVVLVGNPNVGKSVLILLDEEATSVVLVADAKNLQRALVLATQLAEMEVPFVLTLNMDDEAQALGIDIGAERLSEILGADVLRTVATRSLGVNGLRTALERPLRPSRFVVTFDDDIEEAIRRVMALLPPGANARRWLGLMLLAGHDAALEGASPTARARARATIQTRR